jgi:hypothetical protein
MIVPPKSAQQSTKSTKYRAVRCRIHEQPVQADNVDAHAAGQVADALALRG